MKKTLILSVGMVLLLSGCASYAGAGAYSGATFGSIIGSAIGGIAGGPRGSDIGTLVGMAGGAAVGGVIGAAADNSQRQKYDDRLYGFGEDLTSSLQERSSLEIRNPRIIDANRNGILNRGEEARMVFEIFNTSSKAVYRVQPSVQEVTRNKHIHVSQNILIESIAAGKGIRYTATIKADERLRDGEAVIRIGVLQANRDVSSQTREFVIETSKR